MTIAAVAGRASYINIILNQIKNYMESIPIQDSKYWKNRPADDTYRDWKTESPDWIIEYWKSKNHPHRKQIINVLRKIVPFKSLLEIGCNCGVNLYNIRKKFGKVELSGIDVNQDALDFGKKMLPDVKFFQGEIEDAMSFGDYSVILVDAVLMYVSDKDIEKAMKRITHSAKKAIILCEWFDKNRLGILQGGHYARNYPLLLKELGWKVREKKIIWPTSSKWETYGKIFIATK